MELIRREAARYGALITHSELVGMIPEDALLDTAQWYLQLDGFEKDQVLERRLADMQVCPYCHTDIREDYLVCPHCATRLRGVCRTCGRPIEPGWRACPYCETRIAPVGAEYIPGSTGR